MNTIENQADMKQAKLELESGNYSVAANLFMQLYNRNFSKRLILEIIDNNFWLPNRDEVCHIYAENRECLEQKYPQYYLPEIQHLDCFLIPIDGDEFALFDKINSRFIYGEFRPIDRFYITMFSGQCNDIPMEKQHALLAEAALIYNQRAKHLYESTLADIEAGKAYELSFLKAVDLIQVLNPYEERLDYLKARFYLYIRAYKEAEEYAILFMRKNQHNFQNLYLMSNIYHATGQLLNECHSLGRALQIDIPENNKEAISEALVECNNKLYKNGIVLDSNYEIYQPWSFFPRYRRPVIENSTVDLKISVFGGDYLYKNEDDTWSDFVGLYPESYAIDESQEYNLLKYSEQYGAYMHVKVDIEKAQTIAKEKVLSCNSPTAFGVCGKTEDQVLKLSGNKKTATINLRSNSFKYFRIEENTKLRSDSSFIITKPIPLCHNPKRKKLVLSIFVDALSFYGIQQTKFAYCPNIKDFFEKGAIFSNNFSVAEHTIPVYPSLHTGVYPKTHQFFNDKLFTTLSESIETVEEKFQQAGYYCTAFTSSTQQPYTKSIRGFDKTVLQHGYNYQAHDIVANALEHLEAFQETDNFLWLSILDLHRILEDIPLHLAHQVQEDYAGLCEGIESRNKNSVFLSDNKSLSNGYSFLMKALDMQLGLLFSYINTHYREDEYIVSLFSDHGVPIIQADPWLLKSSQTQTAFMLRGGGVPSIGIVNSEVTSSLDLYPSICRLAGIPIDETLIAGKTPRLLNGVGRDFTISESLYPGQTYKLCLRNLEYEFRLETEKTTTYDGKVDMGKFTANLFSRESQQKIENEQVFEYFMREVYYYTKDMLVY